MNPQTGSLHQKTSFYYPFLLLPRGQRRAMETLYRFCWAADEISDNADPLPLKKKKLKEFKRDLSRCFRGEAGSPLFKNLAQTIRGFQLSKDPFFRVLNGVERDLRPIRFRDFKELRRYCLQVAGGPGLASMEIFGFRDKAHKQYAENLGIFLQLVNMTRDYREDLSSGRQYFPAADFKNFKLNPLSPGENISHWNAFVNFQLDRAWSFLEKSRCSLTRRQRSRLATAEAIASVYVGLFQQLRRTPLKILQGRISLSKPGKLLSALEAMGKCFLWRWRVN